MRSTIIIFLLLILLALLHGCTEPRGVRREVSLSSCHDGDTCSFWGVGRTVRLARIQAPELEWPYTGPGIVARDSLNVWLLRAEVIELEVVDIGYYGRYIGELWADGENVSDRLVASGLAEWYREEAP